MLLCILLRVTCSYSIFYCPSPTVMQRLSVLACRKKSSFIQKGTSQWEKRSPMITNFQLKTKRFLAYVVHQTAEELSTNTMYISVSVLFSYNPCSPSFTHTKESTVTFQIVYIPICTICTILNKAFVCIYLTKQFNITGLAIWIASMLLECALVQKFQAESTGEMLRVEFFAHCRDTLPNHWFLAACTQSTPCSMIVNLTVRLPFMIKIIASRKRHIANLANFDLSVSCYYTIKSSYLASKAIRMPLGIESSNEPFHYCLFTAFATRSKLLIIALPAKGFSIFLMEPICSKMLTTQSAEKVLRMPCSIQSTHNFLKITKTCNNGKVYCNNPSDLKCKSM